MHCKAMLRVASADITEFHVHGFEKPVCHIDDA